MKFIQYFIFGIFVISSGNVSANDFPLQISEVISKNKLTDYKEQKLILLDFWATWCGTCKPATRQLEVVQEQLNKEIFIISVTNETHQEVVQYLKKNPIKLMVIRDFKNNLINKYNITRRPQAILLNTYGKVIWEGHPADLKYKRIKKLAKKYRKSPTLSLEEILNSKEKTPQKKKNEVINEKTTIELSQNNITPKFERSFDTIPKFEKDDKKVKYIGSLFNLLAKTYNIPNHLVCSKVTSDFFVELEVSQDTWQTKPQRVIKLIKKNLPIIIKIQNKIEDVYIFEVIDKNKLLNSDTINLEKEKVLNYTINEGRIKAKNMSISDFALLLSNTKNRVFLFLDSDVKLYNWDLHFGFDDVMKKELLNKYGIKVKKSKINLETINVSL